MANLFKITKILDIFPLISKSDIVSIKEPAQILKITNQCEVKHIMTYQNKQQRQF